MKLMIGALTATLLVVACDAAEESGRRDSVSGAVSGDKRDVPPASDVPEVDAGCKDLRHPGDGKEEIDTCWDPPLHYCSQGLGAGPMVACAFDPPVCCDFSAGCPRCGWTECPYGTPGCPSYQDVLGRPECVQYQLPIGPETKICWDGLSTAR